MLPSDPIFQPGDEVVDFRGRRAKVVDYIPTTYKSNRVVVHFEGDEEPTKTEFYAGVFSHADR